MMSFWAADFADGIPSYVVWPLVIAVVLLVFFLVTYFRRPNIGAALRQAAGSRIALAVGDNFAPSDRFTGFVHEESGASIVLMELPLSAFDQLKKLGDASDTFAAQGVSGVSQETLPGRGGDYIYLRGEQKTALVDYAKYILIFRENGMTGMVTANIPRAALTSGLTTSAQIEGILRSAEAMSDAPQAPNLFTLSYLGPFEEDLSLLGTTKGYRLNTSVLGTNENEPQAIFLVAPSLTQAPIPDLSLFAERSFNGIDQIKDKAIETMHTIEAGGLPAVEVLGHGMDATTAKPALIYQLIIEAKHGGYFRIVGLAPDKARDTFIPEFRKISESFRPAD